MSSVKCPHCGLVNFASVEGCKRCGQPVNEFSPISKARSESGGEKNYYAHELPPPPPIFHGEPTSRVEGKQMSETCVKCGISESISFQPVKKSYLPPLVYLTLLIGPLIFLIVAMIARTRHKVSAPFCGNCWELYRPFPMLNSILSGVMLFAILGGIIIGSVSNSLILGALLSSFGIAVGIFMHFYDKKANIKFGKVDGKSVFIKMPNGKELNFA